ncbi:MAG: hypothetical protein KKG59_06380 [Nanoarchaeota archaeon]|nr:hypothetical protein [Nanoarchaeota archaeon]
MTKIKVYKFRPLANCDDYCRIKSIIETGKFWCSKLWNLNDPMEGVYVILDISRGILEQVFTEKNEYVICAFSGGDALNNHLLWGYYANGYKGVAIEIEVELNEIEKMRYKTKENFSEGISLSDESSTIAKKIITRKLDAWDHETEFRFLRKNKEDNYKIGSIKKIHFGNPYGNVKNYEEVKTNSKSLKQYTELKNRLKSILPSTIESIDFLPLT